MGVYIGTNKYTGGPADPSSSMIPKSIGTAAGDIIYFSGAATPIRLPKGSNGQVLTLANGLPSWQTPSGGGGSSTLAGLSDTSISNPGIGQALLYNGTSWSNSAILHDQNMHFMDYDMINNSDADGSDSNQPCLITIEGDLSRRNFMLIGYNQDIICESGAGAQGEDVFHISLACEPDNMVDGPVDNYICIVNSTERDVVIDVHDLCITDGTPCDFSLVQDINRGEWPAMTPGAATILCYTVGQNTFNATTLGIVSWGGNFLINSLS